MIYNFDDSIATYSISLYGVAFLKDNIHCVVNSHLRCYYLSAFSDFCIICIATSVYSL